MLGTAAAGCLGGDDDTGTTTRAVKPAPDRDRSEPEKPESRPPPKANLDPVVRGLDGQVGVTLGPPGAGPISQAGTLRSGSAWSTIKVPIALRVLGDAGGPDGLSAAQRTQIELALTASDNDAAASLFDSLAQRYGGVDGATAAVGEVLREAGDERTEVSTVGRDGFSPYGQTDWSLREQHRFMAALAAGCVGDRASRRYVLDLMGEVTSDTWGLGSAGVPAQWKGGWGPAPDGTYLVRQMGIVKLDGGPAVVTLAARPNDGTFESGQLLATELVQRLAAGDAASSPRTASPAPCQPR